MKGLDLDLRTRNPIGRDIGLLPRVKTSLLYSKEGFPYKAKGHRCDLMDELLTNSVHFQHLEKCQIGTQVSVEYVLKKMGRSGFEPPTHGFSVRCSTN